MWTTENRGRYDHSKLRYPSDLIDDEWALVEPLIAPGKQGGSKRRVVVRVDSDDTPDGIPIKSRTRFRELTGRDSDLIPDSFST